MKRKSTLVDSVSAEPEVSAVGRKQQFSQSNAANSAVGKKLSIVHCPLSTFSSAKLIVNYPLSIVTALLIVFCLFFSGTAWGQSTTLTVYGDNTTTNEYVPIYGWYCDEKSKVEFIIPADKLSDMNGGSVSAMKFYLASSNSSNNISATFNVFVKEVNATTLTGFTGTTNATIVYSSTISIAKNQSNIELNIPFSSNYVYGGGNLLVGFYQTGRTSYNNTYWVGEAQTTNTAWYGYGSQSGSAQQFLPKITFTYTPTSDPYITLSPSSATVLTGFTQTLTATRYNVSGTSSITYTSSNTNVATVSGSVTSATVTAVAPGTCTITATMTYQGNNYTSTCAITVEDPSYCEPGTGNYDNDGISNVTFGTNGVVVNNTVGGINYGDYSNLVGAVDAGTTGFEVAITYKTSYTYGTVIWVDWDHNYTFEGTEVVYAGQSGSSNPTTLTATFDVPANTPAGDYRMRIIGADQDLDSYTSSLTVAAAVDPCGSYNWSTCHDYTLRVTSSSSCPAPSNFHASEVGVNSVTVEWNPNGGTKWRIFWTTSDNTSWTNPNESGIISPDDNTYAITGLVTGTTYMFRIFGYCGSDDIDEINDPSNYSTSIDITATPSCPKPTGLTASDITNSGATINWTSAAENFEIEYAIAGELYNFDDNSLQGWTNLKVNSDGGEWIISDNNLGGYDYSGYAHSGTSFAMSYSFADYEGAFNTNVYLVSPQSYQISTGASLNFWYKFANSTYPDNMEVCVATAANPTASDFTSIWSSSTVSDWEEVNINLNAYNGQTIWIAFHHEDEDQYEIWIDDVTINAGNVWIPVSGPITTTQHILTGLESETTYSVHVRADCGDDESAWSDIVTFTTLPCPAPTSIAATPSNRSASVSWTGTEDSYNVRYREIYIEEGFESGIPSTWTTIDNDGDRYTWLALSEVPTVFTDYTDLSSWARNGSDAATSASYANGVGSLNTDNWLISPQFLLGGALQFYVTSTYSDQDSYEVLLSTTGTNPSDFSITLKAMKPAVYDIWTKVSIDLSSYAGQHGYIAIHHVSEDKYFLVVDDFGLYGPWQSTTASTNSITLNNLTAETQYEVQVQTDCGSHGSIWESTTFTTLPEYTISASVNLAGVGTITGDGIYAEGATCTLTATVEDDCYTFENWTENGTPVSTNATYSFTVTGNRTLVANFTLNSHNVTVDAGEGGSASQDGNGTYTCGSTARLTATPDACYNFSHWTDGNGGTYAGFNPIEITVDHDITFTAHFTLKTYTITTVASPNDGGTITGGGSYNCGSNATLTATPSSGYYFYQWNDGNTDNPRSINNITSNATYTATFKQAPLTINNTTDWNNFAEAVSHGYTYSGKTVTLAADIEVTTMVGGVNAVGASDDNVYFCGTFNGGCNTITFNKATATEQYTAPFRRINGATIQNLKVAGTVSSTNRFAGGVVAYAKGTSTVTNCINSTSITSTGNTHGGIVGMVGGSGTINITGCVFDGTMSSGTDWSGILGLNNTNCTANIRDCLFIPESVSVSSTSGTMLRNNGTAATVSNCYYTQTMTNNEEGTRVYSVTGGTGVDVSLQGSATQTYSCSDLAFYASGLTFNGTIYGSNLVLSLSYEGLISGYTTSNGDLSGSSHTGVNDEYTLASLSGNAIINQTPCPFDNPPTGLIWKGGTDGDVTNWEIATNWAVYNESETRYQLAGSAPSESSNVFIISNDACNIEGVPSLSSNKECNDITLAGIGVNIADGKYLTVNGTATFTSGIVTGDVTFGSGATVSGASTSSYVNGKVTRNGMSGAFTFPTGTATLYAPFKATSSSASNVSVQYAAGHDGMPDWWNHSGNLYDAGLNHASDRENWQLSASASTELSSIILYWNESDNHSFEEGNEALNSYLSVAAVKRNGFNWQNLGRASIDGNNVSGSITAAEPLVINITGAKAAGEGDYFVTFASSNNILVLPIELTSFTATCDGRSTLIEWTTATERNNDYFSLERSDDAINFVEIARIAGAGNSIDPVDYSYTDYGIHGGDNYYRLVQVDYDGTRTVSEVIVANCIEPESDGEPEVLAYPNPFSSELTVVLDNFGNRAATIEVYDMLGKLIYTNKVASPQNSYETILNLSNLPPAAYTVRVSTNDFVINRNVVKQ